MLAGTAYAAADLDALVEKEAKVVAPDAKREGKFFHDSKEEMEWFVPMKVGRCYWVVAHGSEKIKELSLYLWNDDGDRMTENREGSKKVSIVHCPWEAGMFRFQVKIAAGKGPYSAAVYSKPGEPMEKPKKKGGILGTGIKFGKKGKKESTVTPLGPLVDDEAASSAPGAARVGDFYESDEKSHEWFVELEKDSCYYLVGVGEKGKVKGLSLYLWSPKGKRVTENTHGSEKVSIAHCSDKTGMYRFPGQDDQGQGSLRRRSVQEVSRSSERSRLCQVLGLEGPAPVGAIRRPPQSLHRHREAAQRSGSGLPSGRPRPVARAPRAGHRAPPARRCARGGAQDPLQRGAGALAGAPAPVGLAGLHPGQPDRSAPAGTGLHPGSAPTGGGAP